MSMSVMQARPKGRERGDRERRGGEGVGVEVRGGVEVRRGGGIRRGGGGEGEESKGRKRVCKSELGR